MLTLLISENAIIIAPENRSLDILYFVIYYLILNLSILIL